MPSLAALCSPPAGFCTPVATEAVRELARASADLGAFWRESARADWMLYLLGWHAAELRPMVQALATFVAQEIDRLPQEDSAARALVALQELDSDQDHAWPGEFPEDHLASFGSGAHEVQAAVDALARVAAWEHGLGPDLPLALANTALWCARARATPGPWTHQRGVLDRLRDGAEHLRTHVPPSLIGAARPPTRLPSSYPQARRDWPGLWTQETPPA